METENNRVTAEKCLLINWSRFQYEIFCMSGSTLITGVNGTGKSTILDAIMYLLTGNKKFNAAAGDRDRKVLSYVRGDTKSNGDDRYLRSGEITSYIAMEFYSPSEQKYITVGVVMESVSEAGQVDSKWFVFPDTRFTDISFCEEDKEKGTIKVTPRISLTVKGRRLKGYDFYPPKKGPQQILRALGLRVDVDRYRSKLLKTLAFDPENNIDQFIQNSVLDEDPIDSLARIKEYRNQYAELKQVYDDMMAARRQLESVEKESVAYEDREHFLHLRELLLDYQNYMASVEERENIKNRLRFLTEKLASEKKKTDAIKKTLERAQKRLRDAESNEAFQNISGTIDSLKARISEIGHELKEREKAREKLSALEAQIRETLSWNIMDGISDDENKVLNALSSKDISEDVKHSAFLSYTASIEKMSSGLSTELVHLNDSIDQINRSLTELYSEKKRLESNQLIFDKNAEAARDLIEKELKSQGIDTDVFLLAELVQDIKDPKWRMAIETFLGRKRFYLVSEPKLTGRIMQIIHDKKINGINLVMADRLPEKLDETEPGSAADQLVITNTVARRYINYLLGRIILCASLDELHDHPLGGIMQDGMLAKSYAVSRMDMRKTRVCLGKDALELQKKEIAERIKETKAELEKMRAEKKPVSDKVSYIRTIHTDISEYDFDVEAKIEALTSESIEKKKQVKTYENNPAFTSALLEQQAASKEVNEAQQALIKNNTDINICSNSIDEENAASVKNDRDLEEFDEKYRESISKHPELSEEVVNEYQKFRSRSDNAYVITEKRVNEIRNELHEKYQTALEAAQVEYLKIVNRIDYTLVGPKQIPFYRGEYQNLKNVKIDETRQRLEEKSEQLETAFMNDFVAELKEKMDNAKAEIDGINKELARTPFGSDTYRFEVKPRADRAAFFEILKTLDEYQGAMEFMLAQENANSVLNSNIREFMNVILSEDDEEEYTDYRRYFTYDMKIRSRQGDTDVEADLSAKQGSASGGEKQTPYFIILAASLLQCYPRERCCERLVFIDEAFSALSRERIEQMVKYLEENHFQVIYAAPPEKIESIGSHIDTTISLVTKGRYTFTIEGLRE